MQYTDEDITKWTKQVVEIMKRKKLITVFQLGAQDLDVAIFHSVSQGS